MPEPEPKNTTPIIFCGAGPGDPDLITVKGQQALAKADLVIYAGSLVPEAMLKWTSSDCESMSSAGMHLDEMVDRMAEAWRAGKRVVRLHTGDPSLYGAIFEQMAKLSEMGIPYTVIPGVTAAFAAAASMKVEYTPSRDLPDPDPDAHGRPHAGTRGRDLCLPGRPPGHHGRLSQHFHGGRNDAHSIRGLWPRGSLCDCLSRQPAGREDHLDHRRSIGLRRNSRRHQTHRIGGGGQGIGREPGNLVAQVKTVRPAALPMASAGRIQTNNEGRFPAYGHLGVDPWRCTPGRPNCRRFSRRLLFSLKRRWPKRLQTPYPSPV